MKARLVLDQFADVTKCTEEQRAKLKFQPHKHIKGKVDAIYPKGTEFEGEMAVFLCRTGQAAPIDAECAEAVGMSPEQATHQQTEYKMDNLGIHEKGDRELFRAGVITGYDADKQYLPGPNWEAYQEALADSEDLADELDEDIEPEAGKDPAPEHEPAAAEETDEVDE